jgi:hypothetical protein
MIEGVIRIGFLCVIAVILFSVTVALSQTQRDLVKGNLIQFNDNGAWCWYQDERAIVDTVGSKVIIGSDASDNGVGGRPREGDVDAVIFDLQTRTSQRFLLKDGASDPVAFYADDHNAPAFLVRPDGKYVAMYAAHNTQKRSYWRIFDGSSWSPEQVFDWNAQPGGADFNTTYSNMYSMTLEGRVYNIARGAGRSPNFIVSTNSGDTWSYGGRVTFSDVSVGYVDGYFRYCGNGVDRIDFICTEHHPRDYNTSIYHGYIKNGQTFRSDGTLMDSTIFDQKAPNPFDYTPVFAANTEAPPGQTNTRCWNIDVQRYEDGSIAALISTRVNDNPNSPSNDPDHAFFYCRYDGTSWSYTYLGNAGKKLYSSEQDYTGLGALCPNDPNTIYISTPFDPRDGTNLGVHEIFRGVTADHGATWTWAAITQNSVRDNFRPIVPGWNKNNTALLWFRGTYFSAQNFDAAVVGILDQDSEALGKMTYLDATTGNTTLATGNPLDATGPDPDQGPADNKWHIRTGYGNGGSVLTSAEAGGENAPALKTRVTVPQGGTYDVWVNFWANPSTGNDWRIKAGLSSSNMQLFRQMACKQVEAGDHSTALVLSGGGNTFLYQAYLGRVQISANDTLDVFVDDEAIQTGQTGPLVGDVCRTWYDGVSYAEVGNGSVVSVSKQVNVPNEFVLGQNYPNPFNPMTTIDYSLPKDGYVSLKVYNLLGQEVAMLVGKEMVAGSHRISWNAQDLPSGVYFYKITVGSYSKTNKMVLLK